MNEGQTWEDLPPELLEDCAQLVKANSIEGNKKQNISIIYTPWSNLLKSGDMATGQVSFHNTKKVRRIHVETKDNAIVNRLNKTKVEKFPDLFQEKVDHQKRLKKKANKELQRKKLEEKRIAEENRKAKELKSYDRVFEEALGPVSSSLNSNKKSSSNKSKVTDDIFAVDDGDDDEGVENAHANDFDDFF
ncbi:hypothetical protein H4219_003966 [Mycoemilia scoparia]|uniref:NFACT RNA-binding domain-containing protein n=1 Tax=Mycoemilia scoparia TaxID=417184 RepID=A0A9W8DM55_9FUNG|nr:hypothetical protein H4219_003966 [Mycoemilia scoparia]